MEDCTRLPHRRFIVEGAKRLVREALVHEDVGAAIEAGYEHKSLNIASRCYDGPPPSPDLAGVASLPHPRGLLSFGDHDTSE